MNIIDLMNIMNIMSIMNTTAWMAMAGAVFSFVCVYPPVCNYWSNI